jgi:hypothetical protein
MQTIMAPYPFLSADLFLAGSIEMDTAAHWQTHVIEALHDLPGVILNPRRADWDASWIQDIHNDQFRAQVEWELRGLEIANAIMVCFDPNTRSPITLLELGLTITKPLYVVCPEGFWRKGNVDIVCHRYGHPVYPSLVAGIAAYRHDHALQGAHPAERS